MLVMLFFLLCMWQMPVVFVDAPVGKSNVAEWALPKTTIDTAKHQPFSITLENAFPATPVSEIYSYQFFTLAYSETHEQACCVAYLNTRHNMQRPALQRKYGFRYDSRISTGSALPRDYKNSRYDRGHLCPAGDVRESPAALKETFLMSNISPQLPSFNRGMWKTLEETIREWVWDYDSLLVLTGPVLTQIIDTIGTKNRVSVPALFYKIVIHISQAEYRAVAFLMPNAHLEGNLFDFQVSIDSIEQLTHLNFFPNGDHIPCIENMERETDWQP